MIYQNENFAGTYDFRCRFHANYDVEAHLHEYSEIVFCRAGRAELTVNGRAVCLLPGQLILIPPNYIHGYTCRNSAVIGMVFSNDFVRLFYQAVGNRRLLVTPIDFAEMADLLMDFPHLKREDHLRICGYLHLICAKVLEHAVFEGAGQGDGILYQKVISYLSEHYAENVTLKSVAKRFGYHEKYLSSTLHQLTGINFRSLLALYRVEHAKELLQREPGIGISEIAALSGFASLNTFNRMFREMTGMTPSAYKQGALLQK